MRDKKIDQGIIKEAIHQSVAGKETTVTFEKVWEESQKMDRNLNKKRSKKKFMVAAFIAATLVVTTISAECIRRIDNITYSFENDEKVLGPWTVVDFVKKESDFQPGKIGWQGEDFYLRFMDFKDNGILSVAVDEDGEIIEFESSLKWTNKQVINAIDKTNSRYTIKQIDGKNYLFYEWKTTDYMFGGQEPGMYVLEQGKHVETVEAKGKTDDTNVPFENDDAMKGKWVAVDIVKEIKDFEPGARQWHDLYLKSLLLKEGGVFEVVSEKGTWDSTEGEYWTKGAIVSNGNQTVSECVIKEINGETYMFYQWKSGDYTLNGMRPGYYVLMKE